MLLFPNCKINLGLNIFRKREDGYHDLETVFYPVPLKDGLEIIREQSTVNSEPSTVNCLPFTDDRSEENSDTTPTALHNNRSTVNGQRKTENGVRLTTSGLIINGNSEDNLCIKAYYLLKKDFPSLPNIQMHLHKVIPMGAGLGGGSADGAFALKLLNYIFHLKLSSQQLIDYALQLGSDCPFFILNKPCFATGRGEKMEEMALDLSAYQFVIINPKIHIGTGWAFGNITPKIPSQSIKNIITQPIHTWKDTLLNDFEPPAIHHYPEIGAIKKELYRQGAVYSSMTGSGSTVFGIFEKAINPTLSFPEYYFLYNTSTAQ